MKIAIFSEGLLKNSGGAEVYALKLAETLSQKHSIDIITASVDNVEPKTIYEKYNTLNFTTKQIRRNYSDSKLIELFFRIIFWLKLKKQVCNNYDYYINTSCNRMIGFKKTNSIHLIHFPVQPYSKIFRGKLGFVLDNYYRNSYKQFWANSEFTKKYVKEFWNIDSIVLNPPIDMRIITNDEIEKKEDIIIAVGRLVPDKKIKELIEAFLSIHDELNNYKFVVIGNKDTNNMDYYEEISSYADNNKCIKILSDVSYSELVYYYKRAKLFWHAKGVGIDESNPLLMEHFGMTTVEAMANGCVPIVINKAGQKEIVEPDVSGMLWDSFDQLKQFTIKLANDCSCVKQMREEAIERSKLFLMQNFTKKVGDLIK